MIYWDSSAFIKRYLSETGSEKVLGWLHQDSEILTSHLTYAEILATFSRKRREGALKVADYQKLCSLFEQEWGAMTIIQLKEELHEDIKRVLSKHSLRGADAIHLASALHTQKLIGLGENALSFACADRQLLQAAQIEGLNPLNPLSEE